jgi:hypothetical protein
MIFFLFEHMFAEILTTCQNLTTMLKPLAIAITETGRASSLAVLMVCVGYPLQSSRASSSLLFPSLVNQLSPAISEIQQCLVDCINVYHGCHG